jgi:predicted TIM-barrel fold metal-dependent hydrolase
VTTREPPGAGRDLSGGAGSSDRLVMLSADCHGGPKPEDYRPWLEERYHDALARYVSANRPLAGDRIKHRPGLRDRERRIAFATDPAFRIGELEAQGFVGEVVFPDPSDDNEIVFTGYFGQPGDYPADLYRAGLRAYNRWQSEVLDTERQMGLAVVPMDDPAYAATQVERAPAAGLRGVMPSFDGSDHQRPPLFDPAFDRMWDACAADGLVVCFHGGSGVPFRPDFDPTRKEQLAFAFETMFWPHRPLWHMILGGVLERHPDLKVLFAETHADWIPRALVVMDQRWELAGPNETCRRPPSEYWHRQGFVGAAPISHLEVARRHEIGVDNLMFGADLPHSIGPWTCATPYLQLTLGAAGVPESEVRAIVGGNLARAFGLDLTRLGAIAEHVGPAVEEVCTPPTDATWEQIPEYLRGPMTVQMDRQPLYV